MGMAVLMGHGVMVAQRWPDQEATQDELTIILILGIL